jgi:hypothetical protein
MAYRGDCVLAGFTARGILYAGVLLVAGTAGRAAAAENESRHFAISVDGKPAGTYVMTLDRQDNTETMTGRADVRVSKFVYTYTYNYQGTEVWKDGKLQQLRSSTNDNGKRFTVSAWADAAGLHVQVNGAERQGRADVWTTTYWHLPDERFRNQPVPLLDADTGRDINGVLHLIGTQQIPVAGQVQSCGHYRVSGGGLQVELWYDANERLVRQESMEDGHRTVLELTAIGH